MRPRGVATPMAMAVSAALRSRSSGMRRVSTAASPEPAASTSATVTVPPPSSDLEICTGAPSRGELSHGAPVWVVW